MTNYTKQGKAFFRDADNRLVSAIRQTESGSWIVRDVETRKEHEISNAELESAIAAKTRRA